MKLRTEKYARDRYFVYRDLNRVGHIIAGRGVWYAERGARGLGAHRTKRLALAAIEKVLRDEDYDNHQNRMAWLDMEANSTTGETGL